jgi:tetratricopeptide (TPR) repeat protein
MRRRWLLVIPGVALGFATWGILRVVDSWRYRASLAQAKAQIASGSPYGARRLLVESVARWPGEGELKFLLGACEQALGRPDAAEAAWSRVPADSPFAGAAAMLRVRLLLKRDRFAASEELLPVALRASGEHAIEARETLVALFKLEGRFAEVRALVREGWDSYPDRFGLLRQLANLDSINPFPIEKIWPALQKGAENSPDDDRIWLGRANLAIRTGEFDKARGWLDDCLRRRPRDAAVWKGRLDLALAMGNVALTREALGHLPPGGVPPEEVLALHAWFAARSGDQERERQALEDLLARAPGQAQAVERLAELELLAGRPESAARLCARKAELDRAKIHYEILVTKPSADAVRHSIEMARLAEVLGRSFEARSLWSVAMERSPSNREAREALIRLEKTSVARAGPTLAALLAELGPAPAQGAQSVRRLPASPAFTDDAEVAGLRFRFDNGATPSRQIPETMSGGVGLLDYDGDGWLDDGHVDDFRPEIPYAMAAQLLLGGEGGKLTDASDRAGSPWQVLRVARGLAAGDLDNDRRVDLLVGAQDVPLAYFHNRSAGGHSLTVHLEGTTSNRDAVGARVAVLTGKRRQVRWRFGGGSYQSACDSRLHFGLGDATVVDMLKVTWPSGRLDRFGPLTADAGYRIREGSGPTPLTGFPRRSGLR